MAHFSIVRVFMLVTLLLCQACATSYTEKNREYRADDLIQEWRKNVGTAGYPHDNDYEYRYPQPQPRGYARPPQPLYPYPQDNDAEYTGMGYKGAYPIYNPDDDNNPIYYYYHHGTMVPSDNDSEYSYPMYFDN